MRLIKSIILRLQKLFLKFDKRSKRYPYIIDKDEFAPIFIVGAPRTGSTILFQLLISNSRVIYLTNLMALLPSLNTLILKLTLKKIIHYQKIKKSNLGFIQGLNAPNEGGALNRLWFGKGQQTDKHSKSVKNIVNGYSYISKAPYLSKNMLNSSIKRLNNIIKIFPNAKFIYLKRNILFNAQSILLSRKKFYGGFNTWLSIKPNGYEKVLNESPEFQTIWQVKKVNNNLEMFFNRHNISPVRINYEKLCRQPNKEIKRLIYELNLKNSKKNKDVSKFVYLNNKRKVDINSWNNLKKSRKRLINENII